MTKETWHPVDSHQVSHKPSKWSHWCYWHRWRRCQNPPQLFFSHQLLHFSVVYIITMIFFQFLQSSIQHSKFWLKLKSLFFISLTKSSGSIVFLSFSLHFRKWALKFEYLEKVILHLTHVLFRSFFGPFDCLCFQSMCLAKSCFRRVL